MSLFTLSNYHEFRKSGLQAKWALQNAKTLSEWNEYVNEREDSSDVVDGCVRLRAEPENESYFDVFGEPDTDKQRKVIEWDIHHNGCWCVIGEYLTPEGDWESVDSIGMCIYDDPCDPFENYYVPDIMRSTLDAMNAAWAEHDADVALCSELASLD